MTNSRLHASIALGGVLIVGAFVAFLPYRRNERGLACRRWHAAAGGHPLITDARWSATSPHSPAGLAMNMRELIEKHPALMRDRDELTFTDRDAPDVVANALSQHGVVMLRGALPATSLLPSRLAFHQFTRTLGKNHRLWDRRFGGGDDGPDRQWAAGEDFTGSGTGLGPFAIGIIGRPRS